MLRLKQTLLKRISLATLGAAALLAPAQAMAADSIGGRIYAYAYQQVTNLRALFTPTPPPLQPNTSAGGGVTGISGPGQITATFDVQESFTGASGSGINQGLGNNFGFLDAVANSSALGIYTPIAIPIFPETSNTKGIPDYARSDAVLASGGQSTGTIPIVNVAELQQLLFTTDGNSGVDTASVAESYLNFPATTPVGPPPIPNLFTDEGSGNGEYIIGTQNFTLAQSATIRFEMDYRNRLYSEIVPTTPAGLPPGVTQLAFSEFGFVIQINEIQGTNSTQRFRFAPSVLNQSQQRIEPGVSQLVELSGTNLTSGQFTFQPGITYDISFRGTTRVNTRLFQTVPGPLPVLGAAAAFGWTRKLRKRIRRSTTTPAMAPL